MKIHCGGNAEQYHADKKYKEAVAVAVDRRNMDTALSLANMLIVNQDFAEALSLLRETIDVSRTVLGPEDYFTFTLVATYGEVTLLASRSNPTADIFSDIFYAEKMLGENAEKARRVLGPTHEVVVNMHGDLTVLRKLIAHLRASRETPELISSQSFTQCTRKRHSFVAAAPWLLATDTSTAATTGRGRRGRNLAGKRWAAGPSTS